MRSVKVFSHVKLCEPGATVLRVPALTVPIHRIVTFVGIRRKENIMWRQLRFKATLICTVLIVLQPLAVFSQDNPARKWKLEHTFDIHDQDVACVACSANLVATLDGSGMIRIWDRTSGNLKNKPDRQLEGKPAWLMFTPDGKYLYAASKDVSGMKLLMFDVSRAC